MTHTPHPAPGADADGRTQNTRDTDHIIGLINMGVDFGSMSTIRTLVDEIKYLRAEVEALSKQPPTPASEEA